MRFNFAASRFNCASAAASPGRTASAAGAGSANE
jgi:hypothetical protein